MAYPRIDKRGYPADATLALVEREYLAPTEPLPPMISAVDHSAYTIVSAAFAAAHRDDPEAESRTDLLVREAGGFRQAFHSPIYARLGIDHGRICGLPSRTFRGAVHFVGFRGEEYHVAVRIFGRPDFVHRTWDRRAAAEIAAGDLAVFANPSDDPAAPSERCFDDSNQPADPAYWERLER
jgi:hypothetical protein